MALWQLCSIYTGRGSNMLAAGPHVTLCVGLTERVTRDMPGIMTRWCDNIWILMNRSPVSSIHISSGPHAANWGPSWAKQSDEYKYSWDAVVTKCDDYLPCTRIKITKPRPRCNKAVTGCIYLLANTWAPFIAPHPISHSVLNVNLGFLRF